MTPLFEARDLCKNYGGIKALSLPSFFMGKGELVVLAGRNGSGKSTLLRLLAFLEKPSSGTLRYYGNATEPRKEITLLLQDAYLLKETVMHNVTLGLRLRGEKHGLLQRFTDAMQAVGFSDPMAMADRPQYKLSGGEKQRVALAARIILKPSVLLLDEPTAHVDADSEKTILSSIAHILASGTSVVCATHDAGLFSSFSARTVWLKTAP
ncbi:MAG: energy-coupling factor ABC transporter ATP-binding protein [Mailhella sp.]|nr:energy-coupling factor ABC transporter ATP-binding protein [Mailhella sp.]